MISPSLYLPFPSTVHHPLSLSPPTPPPALLPPHVEVSWHWGCCYLSGRGHFCSESVGPVLSPVTARVCRSQGPEREGNCQDHSESQGQVATNSSLSPGRETLFSLSLMHFQAVLLSPVSESPSWLHVYLCPSLSGLSTSCTSSLLPPLLPSLHPSFLPSSPVSPHLFRTPLPSPPSVSLSSLPNPPAFPSS